MKQGHRVLPRSLRASGDPIQAGVLPGQQDTPTVQALVGQTWEAGRPCLSAPTAPGEGARRRGHRQAQTRDVTSSESTRLCCPAAWAWLARGWHLTVFVLRRTPCPGGTGHSCEQAPPATSTFENAQELFFKSIFPALRAGEEPKLKT